MTKNRTRLHYAALLALVSLGGCSGGGGGSSPVTPTPVSAAPASTPPPTSNIPINLQAPATTVTYQAAAVTATGAGKGMGNITISAPGQGATVTLGTDSSGNLSRVTTPPGITISVDGCCGSKGGSLADPGSLLIFWQLVDPLTTTNTVGYGLSQAAAGQGLTYSAYGAWARSGASGPGDAGFFAFGNLTPTMSVPTTGSATFTGFSIGLGGPVNSSSSDGSSLYVLKGNAQIVANFATQSVTTNLTNFEVSSFSFSPAVSVPNLTGTSTISGNAYTGAIAGGGLAGTINGNFYGSAAQETAGVWQASGGGNAWIGSFGAK